MVRTFHGNEPEHGVMIGIDGDAALFVINEDGRYLGLKLIATEPRERKANFWIGWDTSKDCFTRSRDCACLHRNWPEKLVFVKKTVLHYVLIGCAQ